MATLRDYFVSESNDYFVQLNEQLNRLDAGGDAAELMRVARALRGAAQLARESRVYRAGLGLESVAKAITAGAVQWSADLSERARRTLEDMKALAAGGETEDAADARVKRVLDRWRGAGVPLPDDAGPAAPQTERSAASKQFREFAAHEAAGIAAEIDAALVELGNDPRNREVLKAILRRQRALTGAARLDEISVLAETLRAIEDLVRVIHKLNVAVKEEWAAVLRASREVLTSALEPLKQGQDPKPTPALSKLRTLRTELLERYGEGEAVNLSNTPPKDPMASMVGVAAVTPPPVSAPAAGAVAAMPQAVATPEKPAVEPAAPAAEDRVVPIEELCYSGERALRRALDLRPRLESIAGDDSDARESVEELFDLIRLSIG